MPDGLVELRAVLLNEQERRQRERLGQEQLDPRGWRCSVARTALQE
jgi:hypothetical protein